MFGPKTVSQALTALNKALADLKAVVEHNRDQAVKHRIAADEALDKHAAANAEAANAFKIAAKLEALITA